MKKRILIILISFVFMKMEAQQLPQYSNYMINDYALNPAIGGTMGYFEGKSNNRYQWIGITDAPRTYVLSVNGPLKNLNMGVGGQVFTDIVGPTRRTGLYGSYAYHIRVAEKIKVSLGLNAGILQFMVDGSKITKHDPLDPVLTDGIQYDYLPDFGAGVYAFSTDHKWYVGISVPQIMNNKIKFFDNSVSSLSKLSTHLYVTAGYKFNVGENFKIEPSTCLKYVKPAPFQFDLGVRGIYKEKLWLGAAYRYLDAISIMVGYTMQENITFAYSYDITTTNIKKYSTGTHELMIGIKFHKTPESKSAVKMQ